MGDPKVKGLAFRSVLKSLEALRGQVAVAAALGAMDPEVADAYRRNTILATGWYPIAWYREAFRAIVATTSPELPRAIGAEAIRADLDGVHKLMLRMLSPETAFSLSSKLFGKYYDTGSLRIAEGRNGFTRAEAGGCTGRDRNMWLELLGSSERVLELAGARHVRMRITSGGSDQDDHCTLEAHWA